MKKIYKSAVTLSTLLLASLAVFAQTQSRDDVLKQIQAKRAQLSKLEETYLAPTEEDRARYASFLKQPDTGLIRLLPREKFDSEGYRQNTKTIVMRGGGAYYSFSRLTHEYGYGSDIELGQGAFSVGFAGADYGFITNLGDVPIENVGMDTHAATVFAAYRPPKEEHDVRQEAQRLGREVDMDDVKVSRRVNVELDSTYLLRSFDFGNSDVLVAFRVVRIDSDDSVVIAWKMLKKFSKPDFNRAKTVD